MVVSELTDAADPLLRDAHRLLSQAFSRSEMLPVSDWRNALAERAEGLWTDVGWHLLVAVRDGKLLGAATGSYLGNVNAGIIGYIAITPEARSLGLGPKMRQALKGKFEKDAKSSGYEKLDALVGEVRADNPWLGHLVRREGAIALDFPYVQPSLGGSRDPVELVLYYQPLSRRRSSLAAPEVRRLLYTLWRRVYRIKRPLADINFRRMLRSLSGDQRIGQRHMEPPKRRTPRR